MKAFINVALSLFVVSTSLASVSCEAQVSTGTPKFGSFAGYPDAINLGNLNAHWDIPIRDKAGRGQDFKYDLTYDSSVWYPVTSGSTKTWQPVTNWGWQGLSQAGSVYASYTMTYSSGTCGQYGQGNYQIWSYNNVTYHDEHGIAHWFSAGGTYFAGTGGTACPPNNGPSPSGTIRTTDSAGFICYYSINQGSMSLSFYNPQGDAINAPIYVNSAPPSSSGSTTDTSGNQVSWSNGSFIDTLGQTALGITGTAPSNTILSFVNNSGSYSTYTVSYVATNIKTNFGCSGVGEYTASSVYLVNSITLPEGTSYQFTYEPTPGISGYSTGRVASVKLPTGGTISYTYSGSNNGIECQDGSAAGLTRTTPDGATAYSRTGSGNQWTTTAIAPAYNGVQDQTVIHFLTDGLNFYEIERQLYAGPSTLLETLLTCYESSDSNCSSSIGDSGTKVTTPITRVKKTNQLQGTTGTVSSGSIDTYDAAMNVVTHSIYDYAAGSVFGALLQTTTNTFSTAYSSVGIEVKTEAKTTDGQANQVADTKYYYSASTIATSGTPSHVSGSLTVQNLASMQKWVAGSSTQTTQFAYYDTGNPATMTDVNGNVTTYTYGGCGNSFVTGISTPVKNPAGSTTATLATSSAWNCSGGVQTSTTDPNTRGTTYNYGSDPYWRPTSITDAAGNVTSYTYPTSSSNSSSSSLSFNSGSSVQYVRTTFDSLGRELIHQVKQGPNASNYDSTAMSYDSRGRKACETAVPYSAAAGSYTAPSSSTGICSTYDAIDRITQKSDAGGGTVSYSYNLNDTLMSSGPAPTGENLKQRSLGYNGLGQISSVCEISSTLSGAGSCSQNTAHNGYLTKYTYDGPLLTKVAQNAQGTAQNRTIYYDGLGRKTSETIPEWGSGSGIAGTTAYTFDSDSSGACSGSFIGDLIKSVDSAGNVTCFSYDSVHRLLSATVVSGPYVAVTPARNYVYDAATYGSTSMQNAIGQLAEAYTGPSTSKLTDLYFSQSFSTTGATTGGAITQVWEKTPNSGTYYQTTNTYFPNGALGNRSTSYGAPTVSYGVDGEGRQNSATDTTHSINLVTAASYNSASSATGVTFGNGDSDSFGFDSHTNRPTSMIYTITGSSPFTISNVLTWNPNSSLKQMQITDTNDSSKNQTCSYSADDLARISSVNCGSSTWAQTFAYDAFGNINKTGTGNATSYLVSYSGQTNQVSGGPAYDGNGNQRSSTGLSSISWDAEANPISVSPLSGGTITGTFDALGRLVENHSSSAYTQFIYSNGGSKLAVMTGGTTLVKAVVPLPGGESAVYNASGLNFIRHKDWLASSRLGTTWAHSVYSKEAYAPFGETYNEAGTPDRSFTGQDQDTVTGSAGTGTYDFLFRKYDPAAGRWITPDPLGWNSVSQVDPRSFNRYAYVLNQPLSLFDPLGLDCVYIDPDTGSLLGYSPGDCDNSSDSLANEGNYVDGTVDTIYTTTGDQNGAVVGWSGTDSSGQADAGVFGYQPATTTMIVNGDDESGDPPITVSTPPYNPYIPYGPTDPDDRRIWLLALNVTVDSGGVTNICFPIAFFSDSYKALSDIQKEKFNSIVKDMKENDKKLAGWKICQIH